MGGDRYDVIVIGAGPAGSSAALTAARENMSVLLIERGLEPGTKKLFAGLIHRAPMDEIIPGFWEEAPVERAVVSDELWLLDKTSAVKVGFTGLEYAVPPYNKFTVLRTKWDKWLAGKAQQAGATLLNKTVVRDLLFDREGLFTRKVVGVKTDSGDQIYAHTVIIAEGCSAALVEKCGLRKQIIPKHLSLQAIEILHLPAATIEDRFHLAPNEGAVIGIIGFPNSGAVGKGGIWVQKDSVALSVGGFFDQMIDKGLSPYPLLSHLKNHPLIKRLLAGAETVAYGSHMIPKGGYNAIPRLVANGVLVTGDAAGFISGRRGADLAMLSGKYAGETAAQARAKGQYTEDILKAYEHKLRQSFFYKDMLEGKNSVNYFHCYGDSDYLISKTANELAYEFFRVGLETNPEKLKKLKSEAVSIQPLFKTLDDVYEGVQHWGIF